jgi:hypothetical protein
MIVAATRSPNFRGEFRSSPVLPSSHDFPVQANQSWHLLHSLCKEPLNVFNHIQPLLSAFFNPNPFLSTSSSLFFAKPGGRGITMLPKYFNVSYSRYLQRSQQNTNSLHFFATSTLCFHHFMNSFRKKHPG